MIIWSRPKKKAKRAFGPAGVEMLKVVKTWVDSDILTRILPANEDLLQAAASKTPYKQRPGRIDRVVTVRELCQVGSEGIIHNHYRQLRHGASARIKPTSTSKIKAFDEIFTCGTVMPSIDDVLCRQYMSSLRQHVPEIERDVLDNLIRNFRQLHRTIAWHVLEEITDEVLNVAVEFQREGFPVWSRDRLRPPSYIVVVSNIPTHLKQKKRD